MSYKVLLALLAGLPLAAAVTLSGTSQVTGPGSGSGAVSLVADQAWTAASSDAWLTVSPASGTGNRALTFTYSANNSLAARMATITVSGKQFVVSQLAANGAPTIWAPVPTTATLPEGIGVDGNGNIYIPDATSHVVRKLTAATGQLTTIAGTGALGSLGDGGPATAATLESPRSVAIDPAGNVFIADDTANRVRRIDALTGNITTFAGTGLAGSTGDGGAATGALLRLPYGVAADTNGNLFIADLGNHRIRKVEAGTGIISTLAGTGAPGFAGDGAAATSALLFNPSAVAVDGAGNVYIADSFNHRIRKVTASNSFISTVAGTGTAGFGGDGGAATAAQLNAPRGVAVDPAGDIYVADSNNHRVRKVTVANNSINNFSALSVANPSGVATDGVGHVYVADTTNNRVLFFNVYAPPAALSSSTEIGSSYGGGSGTLGITTTPAGAAWTAATSAPWITLSTSSGTGAGTLTYTIAPNPGLAARSGILAVNGATISIVQTGLIFGTPTLIGPGASPGVAIVSAPPAASWTASSSASWLTLTTPSGTGNGEVRFNVTANPGTVARMATITVGGKAYVVTQPAANGAYTSWGTVGSGLIREIVNSLNLPAAVAADGNGNVYIADSSNNAVLRIDALTRAVTTVAQSPAVTWPKGVATDRSGNVYVADTGNQRIRKIAGGTGAITTVAGGGLTLGDGGPATSALLSSPPGMAVDGGGNLYIADANGHRIRRVDAATGIINTVAGNGEAGVSGDGGPAVWAQIAAPWGVALDPGGNLYFSDYLNHRVRRVDAGTGVITTIAGVGTAGFSGDGGPATAALLNSPRGLAVDAAGDLYFADNGNYRIRKVTVSTGVISTIPGASLFGPEGVAIDPAGNLLIADTANNRILFADLQSPAITLSAVSAVVPQTAGTGTLGVATVPGNAYWAVTSSANWLTPLVTSGTGSSKLTYSYASNSTVSSRTAVLTINGKTHTVTQPGASVSAATLFTGPGASTGSFALTAAPAAPWSANTTDSWLTVTPGSGAGSGTIGYAVAANPGPSGRLAAIVVAGRTVSVTQGAANGAFSPWGVTGYGKIKTIAGNGLMGSNGDGGPATAARFDNPFHVAVDLNGNVYVADPNHRIRKVSAATGIVSSIAGTGTAGFSGDGGSATLAAINAAEGVAVDSSGNVFIADRMNHRIRRISAATGVITTVAGTGATGGNGDGGLATSAELFAPAGVAVAGNGDLFIADSSNRRIRKVEAASRIITTVAQTGVTTGGVAVDSQGNVFFSNSSGNTIHRVDAATGAVTVFAGTGQAGFSGDGGAATAAQLDAPYGLAADAAGNVYVADNFRIRMIDAVSGTIRTLAGIGPQFNAPIGDGGPATSAVLRPGGVAVDGGGNLLIADAGNFRIRFVDYSSATVTLSSTATSIGGAATAGSVTVTPEPGTNPVWAVTGAPNWLTVTVGGSAVNWSAAANNSGFTRVAPLTIGDKTFTVTQSATISGAPQIVSVVPAQAAALTQTFNVSATDANGDINRIYFLLNTAAVISGDICHGFYDRGANAVFLYNDALTALSAPLPLGTAGTVQSSRCAINGAASSATSAGTDVVLNLSITRQGPYATGSVNLYFWATDTAGLGTGWQLGSTWAIGGGPLPPGFAAVTPPATTTPTQTFAITARDPNGSADLSRIYFLVNGSTTISTNGCHGFYDRAANAFFLYNDGLTALSGPLTPGATGVIGNSQCAIDGPASSVSSAGTDVVLNMNLTRRGGLAFGTSKLFLWATDNEGAGTGWVDASTWTLPAGGPQPPVLAAASPAATTAISQVFSITARDPNGATDVGRIYFLLDSIALARPGSCHGYYDRAANRVFLYDDQLATATSFVPGTAAILKNNQCAINGAGTSASSSGLDVVLNLDMALGVGYSSGTRALFVWITDSTGAGTGWVPASSWTASTGPAQPPVVVSATPASATAVTQSFTLVVRDANGSLDYGNVYFLVQTNAIASLGSCYGFYNPSSNTISLYDDALSNFTGLTPGQPGTIQNSSCSIDGPTASASVYGTDLTLTFRITRKGPAATGIRTLFVMAGGASGNSSGWIPVSTWSIPPVTAHPPTLAGAAPSSANTATATFALTTQDLDGFGEIDRVYFLVNTNPTIPTGGCHGYYDRRLNAIYLYDNALQGVAGPLTPGAAATIQNSQCTVNGAGTSVAASGTNLNLNLSLTRTGSYATGTRSLYIWVTDTTGAGSGWIQASTWSL